MPAWRYCGPCGATCSQKEQFFYEVTFDWPAMPTQTKLIDLGREVTAGFHLSEAPETDEPGPVANAYLLHPRARARARGRAAPRNRKRARWSASSRLAPWSDERAENPDGQQELQVRRETPRVGEQPRALAS